MKDIEVTLGAVDWAADVQHQSRMARIDEGQPVSPKSAPRVEQMSRKEYNTAFGIVDANERGREADEWAFLLERSQTEAPQYGSESLDAGWYVYRWLKRSLVSKTIGPI